jgi:hypothetical protein
MHSTNILHYLFVVMQMTQDVTSSITVVLLFLGARVCELRRKVGRFVVREYILYVPPMVLAVFFLNLLR